MAQRKRAYARSRKVFSRGCAQSIRPFVRPTGATVRIPLLSSSGNLIFCPDHLIYLYYKCERLRARGILRVFSLAGTCNFVVHVNL